MNVSIKALQDVMAGQADFVCDPGIAFPHIRTNKVKLLGVVSAKRSPFFPDVPTVGELGFAAMESVGFQGLVGPAGLPKEVVDKLATELAKVLAQADVKAKFASTGSEVHSLGPVEFFSFVKGENEKWARLIRERKLELD